MYFKHNIHVVLLKFGSYSLRFPVTLRFSCEQSSWVRGENTSLLMQSLKICEYVYCNVIWFPNQLIEMQIYQLAWQGKNTCQNQHLLGWNLELSWSGGWNFYNIFQIEIDKQYSRIFFLGDPKTFIYVSITYSMVPYIFS